MDDAQFDSLVRSLTGIGSRRRALTTLLGGVLVPVLGLTETAAKKKGKGHRGKGKKKPPPTLAPLPPPPGPLPPSPGPSSPTCTDGLKNGSETDVDCGGGLCPRCAEGKVCQLPNDCISGTCTGGRCALSTSTGAPTTTTTPAPSCTNGIKDGTETDIDCGGTCGRCQNGKTCAGQGDCTSALCVNTVCTACSGAAQCSTECQCLGEACFNISPTPASMCSNCPPNTTCRRRIDGSANCYAPCGSA